MKKILMLVLAVFLIVPIAKAQAADVPSFYQVGGRYLNFTGRENTKKGYRVYGYDCSVDLNEDFAEQYLSSLANYGFRFVDHYVNDYRRGQAKLFERWVFVYTGSKRVSNFEFMNHEDMKHPYYGHLVVGRSKNWQTGITYFSVYLSYDLTYAED